MKSDFSFQKSAIRFVFGQFFERVEALVLARGKLREQLRVVAHQERDEVGVVFNIDHKSVVERRVGFFFFGQILLPQPYFHLTDFFVSPL